MTESEAQALREAARAAAQSAYAPYSNFRVGAAVLGDDGIDVGANVENASYGLTLCAERCALASANARGNKNIRGVAVACIDAAPNAALSELMPCGACRQWLQELAPDAEIVICGADRSFKVGDLLPLGFALPSRKQDPLV